MSVSEGETTKVEFVDLKGFDDYEILNDFPYTIRKKANHRVLKDTLRNDGYLQVCLNGKLYLKHRLIALQFLHNEDPINNDVIDHINRDRADNHLSNLRFCSSSENNRNRSSHKGIQAVYIDDIPDNAVAVDFYDVRKERRVFDEGKYYYYYDEDNNEDIFYAKITDEIYKILHHNINKGGCEFVAMRDKSNKLTAVVINRFKQQHDLI